MVLLALIGIGLASTNRKYAPTYWLCLVPVYGILCVSVAWMRSRTGEGNKTQILRQACHWLAIAAAIAIDFSIREKGEGNGITLATRPYCSSPSDAFSQAFTWSGFSHSSAYS